MNRIIILISVLFCVFSISSCRKSDLPESLAIQALDNQSGIDVFEIDSIWQKDNPLRIYFSFKIRYDLILDTSRIDHIVVNNKIHLKSSQRTWYVDVNGILPGNTYYYYFQLVSKSDNYSKASKTFSYTTHY